MAARHLIVTGGTGYLGTRLVEMALAEGRAVTLLGRRPGPVGTRHVPWALGDILPEAAMDPAIPVCEQSLIHLAHDWHADEAGTVDAVTRLFASARAAGIGGRVFISSQSARPGALNRYGRAKWAAEQQTAGGTSLRVGLVYGGPRTAMYGLLSKLVLLPLLPMVDPHRTVQPIHLDEVVQGMLAAADHDARGVLGLAGDKPIAFGDVLRTLARTQRGRRLFIIPLPLGLVLFACDMTARLPLIPTVDRERVLGLAGTEPMESAADLRTLGVSTLPMATRLASEPDGRRATLAEARAFIRYAGAKPGLALLRRYVRAVPEGAIARPRLLLRWREPLGDRSEIAKRLRIASRIAEASASGEATLAAGSRFGRLAGMMLAVIAETLMLPTRLIATLAAPRA